MLTSWFENGGYSTVPLVRDASWTALVRRLTSPPPATIRSWVCATCDHRHSPRRWRPGRCPTCGQDLSPNKRDQPAWSPWTFAGARSKATALSASVVGVEYDGTAAIEDIRRVWARWTHVAHTTWSNTPESPRVRVVVALEREVTPTTWPSVWAALWAVDDRIDRKCSDPSRLWFLPSTRPGVVFESWSHDGESWPVGDEPGGGFAGRSTSPTTGEAQLGATDARLPPLPSATNEQIAMLAAGRLPTNSGMVFWLKAYREATLSSLPDACRELGRRLGFAARSTSATTGEAQLGATDARSRTATDADLADATDRAPARATDHTCHVPGCATAVPPKLLMCNRHWRLVPRDLQRAVWATFRPGQEVDKRPSRAWFDAAKAAIASVVDRPACPPDRRTYPLSERYRTDPALRREVAGRTGAKLVGDRAKGAICPKCGQRAVWWYINPDAFRGARCDHERTCGWVGWLDQIDVRGAA